MSDRGVFFAGFVYGQFATSKHIPCLPVDFGRQGVAFPPLRPYSTRSHPPADRGLMKLMGRATDAQDSPFLGKLTQIRWGLTRDHFRFLQESLSFG